ncbi:hypothetical protein R3X27_16475 [Tropicimonas sp. TH_r6]|uniref:hypothetical protein n=1 Tax=Tropicimonas sp. TH_r6 TaxID=3082085 RepID=UPI0029548F3B|nr:hypothetical protein [Tropicimonas sp. TH_r6]MDV7144282.1 hypothetical protein [Tropicimonas sp. TH_r6]
MDDEWGREMARKRYSDEDVLKLLREIELKLESRIAKLERADPKGTILPSVVVVGFTNPDLTSEPAFAYLIGCAFDQVVRKVGEDPEDFYRRAYAIRAAECQLDDMTDDERAAAYAAGDALRARENPV